jgi:hypothetical protein
VYNLDTKITKYLYNTDSNLDTFNEYNIFYDFINNLELAKTDESLINSRGLTLNTDGNVGCTIADNCTDGNITTVQQCTNMFEALTGVLPSVMNSQTIAINENTCYFKNNDNQKHIVYDANLGIHEVNVNTIGIMNSPGVLLENISLNGEDKWYNFNIYGLDAEVFNVFLSVNGVNIRYEICVNVGLDAKSYSHSGGPTNFSISFQGEIMRVSINFTKMYEDIDSRLLNNNPEVRLYLAIGGGDI